MESASPSLAADPGRRGNPSGAEQAKHMEEIDKLKAEVARLENIVLKRGSELNKLIDGRLDLLTKERAMLSNIINLITTRIANIDEEMAKGDGTPKAASKPATPLPSAPSLASPPAKAITVKASPISSLNRKILRLVPNAHMTFWHPPDGPDGKAGVVPVIAQNVVPVPPPPLFQSGDTSVGVEVASVAPENVTPVPTSAVPTAWVKKVKNLWVPLLDDPGLPNEGKMTVRHLRERSSEYFQVKVGNTTVGMCSVRVFGTLAKASAIAMGELYVQGFTKSNMNKTKKALVGKLS